MTGAFSLLNGGELPSRIRDRVPCRCRRAVYTVVGTADRWQECSLCGHTWIRATRSEGDGDGQ